MRKSMSLVLLVIVIPASVAGVLWVFTVSSKVTIYVVQQPIVMPASAALTAIVLGRHILFPQAAGTNFKASRGPRPHSALMLATKARDGI